MCIRDSLSPAHSQHHADGQAASALGREGAGASPAAVQRSSCPWIASTTPRSGRNRSGRYRAESKT
eukprot:6501197-Pyramimonas_sp.AAC.1